MSTKTFEFSDTFCVVVDLDRGYRSTIARPEHPTMPTKEMIRMSQCFDCGAIVADQQLHAQWHKRAEEPS